jgi:hypothetical protein
MPQSFAFRDILRLWQGEVGEVRGGREFIRNARVGPLGDPQFLPFPNIALPGSVDLISLRLGFELDQITERK